MRPKTVKYFNELKNDFCNNCEKRCTELNKLKCFEWFLIQVIEIEDLEEMRENNE